MVDYDDSTQLNKWLFQSTDELELCRARANNEARTFLTNSPGEEPLLLSSETAATPTETQPLPVKHFAYGFRQDLQTNPVVSDSYREGPLENDDGHAFLTPVEEATLVSFYASKLPSLIGPNASVSRLRRESKVPATAALLYRRFFLSNSVLLYDPKVIMVAAAFLGSKVEDATADVRYLEEGTALMNAPVSQAEIIPAELNLLSGTYFDLLCFHPYKTVLALTEDLRTYLKSDKGQALVSWPPTTAADDDDVNVPAPLLSGQDLKPMYEAARALVDDCVVSDIPLLYTPGQVGLAALMVAQAELLVRSRGNGASNQKSRIPQIDLEGYVRQRFDTDETREISMDTFLTTLRTLQTQLQGLREGQLGCYNNPSVIDMQALKAIHKKLKKVRAWGTSGSGGKSEKKKKKRGSPAGGGTANAVDSGEPERKKMKASGAQ